MSTGLGAVNPATGFFDANAQSYWTAGGPDCNEVTLGGAANLQPAPVSRNLYTNNGASKLALANDLSMANVRFPFRQDSLDTECRKNTTFDSLVLTVSYHSNQNKSLD